MAEDLSKIAEALKSDSAKAHPMEETDDLAELPTVFGTRFQNLKILIDAEPTAMTSAASTPIVSDHELPTLYPLIWSVARHASISHFENTRQVNEAKKQTCELKQDAVSQQGALHQQAMANDSDDEAVPAKSRKRNRAVSMALPPSPPPLQLPRSLGFKRTKI